ncbi:hypothetical protein HO173_012035 [Letharia columbiana]|uniref:Uncharacterized protein n=1 Tax=Letharia columbiana TaxID=112416 RepID=A0A8H6FGR7_9LECA|nr:uncharacterized protein HO173_012035 [Letharia columbiana]KAF6227705.1 hypothetical protein HO173_012035 [Letharia columbiana]
MAADREVVPEAPQPVYDWRRAGYPFEHGEEVVRFLREHLDGEHQEWHAIGETKMVNRNLVASVISILNINVGTYGLVSPTHSDGGSYSRTCL